MALFGLSLYCGDHQTSGDLDIRTLALTLLLMGAYLGLSKDQVGLFSDEIPIAAIERSNIDSAITSLCYKGKILSAQRLISELDDDTGLFNHSANLFEQAQIEGNRLFLVMFNSLNYYLNEKKPRDSFFTRYEISKCSSSSKPTKKMAKHFEN